MQHTSTYKNIRTGLLNTMQRFGKRYTKRQVAVLLKSLETYDDEESIRITAVYRQVCIDMHLIDGVK